jgi:MoaA/NifB/PqqE/SkfB family radical SAM enzyme
MQIEVTSACNCKCVHCYNYWRDKSELALVGDSAPTNMTMDTAKRVLEQCVENELFGIVLTGGEPFLNFPILKWFTEEGIKNGLTVMLNTNLSLITNEQIDWLSESGILGVLTSVLGNSAEVHDKITTVNGSFDATLSRLSSLLNKGVNVCANFVVSQLNCDHLEATVEMLNNYGLKAMTISPVACPEYCDNFANLGLNNKSLVSFLNRFLFLRKRFGFLQDIQAPLPLCALEGVDDLVCFSRKSCSIGRRHVACSATGDIRPCVNFDIISETSL